jgi:twitching motility two-component system response regulator PilH
MLIVPAETTDSPAKRAGACTILIVDDSPTERYYLADLLSKRGYVVIEAGSGEEALLKVRSERPAVVLMDVVMPGSSGYQVTRAIVRDPATKSIPVIICTSKGAESDRIWGLRQGAREYMVKPIDPEELLAIIESLA